MTERLKDFVSLQVNKPQTIHQTVSDEIKRARRNLKDRIRYMQTNISYHKRKQKLAEMRMQRLHEKFPDFDFAKAMKLESEIIRYGKTYWEAFRSSFDAERCADKNSQIMCSQCICKKRKYKY